MKAQQDAQTSGIFDVKLRRQWLKTKGAPLNRLEAMIDWAGSPPLLAGAGQTGHVNRATSKSNYH